MTKDEFEKEARRIVAAFGLDEQAPIQIEENRLYFPEAAGDVLISHSFSCHLEGDDFYLDISRRDRRLRLQLVGNGCEPQDTGSICFISHPLKTRLDCSEGYRQFGPLMARALLQLGYDIDPLVEQAGITVSAHEKMEWLLDLQQQPHPQE